MCQRWQAWEKGGAGSAHEAQRQRHSSLRLPKLSFWSSSSTHCYSLVQVQQMAFVMLIGD